MESTDVKILCTFPDVGEPLPELSSKRGYVYVLERAEVNETTKKLCKVGYTSISSPGRARDYTDGGWNVHFEEEMQDWLARLIEKDMHKALEKYWLDPNIVGGSAQEIFMCAPATAVKLLQSIKLKRIDQEIEGLGGLSEEDAEEMRYEFNELAKRQDKEASQLGQVIDELREILKKQSEEINNLRYVANERNA